MDLKRKIYTKLCQWKENSRGTTSILIEGARRVGKSYIAQRFGENEYETFLTVDFSNISKEILDLFEAESSNLDLFFTKLSVYYGIRLIPRKSLIILDEIQLCPTARQLIKHLVADGRYDYLETGSLITLRKNVETIVIPSEEDHIELFPLDFEEFLWAMGEETSGEYIRQCYENRQPLGQVLHRKVMNLFRQYMLVGGMPQALLKYLETRDFEQTDQVKRRILRLYRDDVTKFAKGYESKVMSIFDEIPSQLSKHEKKFTLASLGKEARFRQYEDAFIWLDESMVVNTCFNSTDPMVGLSLNSDRLTLKCYMADTGLLLSHTFYDDDTVDNEVYKAILFDRMGINEGMFMENMVAQMLRTSGHHLYFYSRYDKENSKNSMEIDFLIRKRRKICPIEVKSSAYKAHASLDKFRSKFGPRLDQAYIIYTKDLSLEDDILCLPIYMTYLL